MSDPITFAVQVLFSLLFLWAVWVAVRRRDVLARDVALILAPIALSLLSAPLRQAFGTLPNWFDAATTTLLLAQPLFSLQLVADIRGLPRGLLKAAAAAIFAATALVVVSGAAIPVALAAIAIFVVTELIAAAYLAVEARRRAGSGRVRLTVAALATAAIAGTLFTLAASVAGPEATAVAEVVIRVIVLVAALGYWVAFLPPRFLRRYWQGAAAFTHSERLFAIAPSTTSNELWKQLAVTSRHLTDATTIVVLEDGGRVRIAASSDPGVASGLTYDDSTLSELIEHAPSGPVMLDLLSRTGQRIGEAVPIAIDGDVVGAILLLRQRPSLFHGDDAALIAALGVRSTYLVQRREVLARQEALTSQLRETVAALESASAAKSDFLASMSHELRTPLNAIIGFSSLMTAQPETDGALSVPREWVEHVRTGGDHLLALINDVLDLAKVESGRLELATESVDVGQAVAAAVAGLRPLADRKDQRVTTSTERDLVLEADPGRLRQILYNLLSNAIKYTPDGGRIAIATSRVGSAVRLRITDSGVGIAAEDQARVFEEFRQVGDATERLSGTGLGLALTRRLVEAHGGRIELDSIIGQGSTFTVLLPADSQSAVPRRVDPTPASSPDGGAQTVLVIEDEASSARLLQMHLAKAGYDVRLAVDGESGLALARRESPAAIVLDILLPGIDGWEVLRRLKSDEALRDIPVIIATVVDERGVGLALGAVDYLVKPIDPTALLERLERHAPGTMQLAKATHVLAIDDDVAALDIIEHTLTPLGFTVQRASSGADGIRLARSDDPDLVICDLMMPEIDGFEVVGQLQGSVDTASIPILIFTAHDLSPADKERLNGRVMGIATKGSSGVDGLRDWLAHVLPVQVVDAL